MRFHKRIKLAPGVRINLSASGVSTSLGGRGASLNFGKRGVFINTSIPGTGLSNRHRLTSTPSHERHGPMSRDNENTKVHIQLDEDGTIEYLYDGTDIHLDDRDMRRFRSQHGDHLRGWLDEQATEWNRERTTLLNTYQLSPELDARPIRIRPNPRIEPRQPVPAKIGMVTRAFRWFKTKRLKREHEERKSAYARDFQDWSANNAEHEERERRRVKHLQKYLDNHHETIERYFVSCLKSIDWPRETIIDFSVSEDLTALAIDIDLPEIEDMPTSEYRVHGTQWRLIEKTLTQKQLRLDYARHIHGIVFRVLSEAFASLPTLGNVVCSGYTQRRNTRTNIIENQYVLSVKATRTDWGRINLTSRGLMQLDPVDYLATLPHSRKMSTSGILKVVEPIKPEFLPV